MTRAARCLTLVGCVVMAPFVAQAFCPEIAVLDGNGNGGSAFPVFEPTVVDLRLIVDVVPDPISAQQLGLVLVTPSGQRFQAFTCVVGGVANGLDCAVGPIDKLLDGEAIFTTWDATIVFPVAGTQLTANHLYGTWQIVPTLDEQAVDCPQSYGFVLIAPEASAIFDDGFEAGGTAAWSSAAP